MKTSEQFMDLLGRCVVIEPKAIGSRFRLFAAVGIVSVLTCLTGACWQEKSDSPESGAAVEKGTTEAMDEKQESLEEARESLLKESSRRRELEERVYRLSVAMQFVADAAFQEEKVLRAREIISEIPTELRGIEWLQRQRYFNGGYMTLYGHTRGVSSLDFSSDGKKIVSSSWDGTVRVWSAETGEEFLKIEYPDTSVAEVALSEDGRRIAVVGFGREAKSIRILDAETGKELGALPKQEDMFEGAAFSPDLKRIATWRWADRSFDVWNSDNWELLWTKKGLDAPVLSAEFSPDGARIAIGSMGEIPGVWQFAMRLLDKPFQRPEKGAGDPIKIWDADTGDEQGTFSSNLSEVADVSFSPDGARLAVSDGESELKVFDIESGKECVILHSHVDDGGAVFFSPDGQRIVASSLNGGTIRVRDAKDGTIISVLQGTSRFVSCIAINPDGRRIATGGSDGTIKLWSLDVEQESMRLVGHTSSVSMAKFSSDGQRVVSSSYDETAIIWDSASGEACFTLRAHDGPVYCLAISSDGKSIATGGWDKTVRVWDAQTGTEILEILGHKAAISNVRFSRDDQQIYSIDHEDVLKAWDAKSGVEIDEIRWTKGRLSAVFYDGDMTRIFSRTSREVVDTWIEKEEKKIFSFRAHEPLRFSPSGKRIVSAAEGENVKTWDAENGKELMSLKGKVIDLSALEFSPDGKRIVTSSKDYKYDDGDVIRIWDAQTGEFLMTVGDHEQSVKCLDFSPDGRRFLSASHDDTIKLWGGEIDENERLSFIENSADVIGASFSADGSRIFSFYRNETVKVWDAESGEELTEEPETNELGGEIVRQKHPTKNLWVHCDGLRVAVVDLNVSDRELAFRRGRAKFSPFVAAQYYEEATGTYAKAFWKGQFVLNFPEKGHYWDEFRSECTDLGTWSLLLKNCNLVLQRGPSPRAEKERAWAIEQIESHKSKKETPKS